LHFNHCTQITTTTADERERESRERAAETDLADGVADLGGQPVRTVVHLSGGGQLSRRVGHQLNEWPMYAGQQSLAKSSTRLISSINMRRRANCF